MQALTFQLSGEYWDSIIYNGQLVLVRLDGAIEVVNWDRLMAIATDALISQDEELVRSILTRGQDWYTRTAQPFLRTPWLRDELLARLGRHSETPLTLGRRMLSAAGVTTLEAPTFPTSDLEWFKSVLYCASNDGLFEATFTQTGKLQDVFNQTGDRPTSSLAASYGTLALASGDLGLFERPADRTRDWLWEDRFPEDLKVSDRPASLCSWSQFDIVGDTPDGRGFVTLFSRPDRSATGRSAWDEEERRPIGQALESELFPGHEGLLLGTSKRVLLISGDGVHARSWLPYKRRVSDWQESAVSAPIGTEDAPRSAQPIDAAIAQFGIVYEYDSSLVVELADGERLTLRGEPINWRVFPRSQRYLNHLHVTRASYLSVYIFWGDYFTEGPQRVLGATKPAAR